MRDNIPDAVEARENRAVVSATAALSVAAVFTAGLSLGHSLDRDIERGCSHHLLNTDGACKEMIKCPACMNLVA